MFPSQQMSGWSWQSDFNDLKLSRILYLNKSSAGPDSTYVELTFQSLHCKAARSQKQTNKSTVNKSVPTEIDGFLMDGDLELPLEWTNMTSVQEFYYVLLLLLLLLCSWAIKIKIVSNWNNLTYDYSH